MQASYLFFMERLYKHRTIRHVHAMGGKICEKSVIMNRIVYLKFRIDADHATMYSALFLSKEDYFLEGWNSKRIEHTRRKAGIFERYPRIYQSLIFQTDF
jgi:hypothetical protein